MVNCSTTNFNREGSGGGKLYVKKPMVKDSGFPLDYGDEIIQIFDDKKGIVASVSKEKFKDILPEKMSENVFEGDFVENINGTDFEISIKVKE